MQAGKRQQEMLDVIAGQNGDGPLGGEAAFDQRRADFPRRSRAAIRRHAHVRKSVRGPARRSPNAQAALSARADKRRADMASAHKSRRRRAAQ
jgi:hypothetical protein